MIPGNNCVREVTEWRLRAPSLLRYVCDFVNNILLKMKHQATAITCINFLFETLCVLPRRETRACARAHFHVRLLYFI
jgi:hypothetical protein